jgi:hypothetical protein
MVDNRRTFDTQPYRSWFAGRVRNADLLVSQPHSGLFDVSDAEAILCCALSGAAADTWPGRGQDEKRFIEFLVEYARNSYPPVEYTSIPLLHLQMRLPDKSDEKDRPEVAKWKAEGERILKDKIHQATGGIDARELRWSDVDDPDAVVADYLMTSLISSKDVRRRVRKATYASVIYSDLRCGLVHELRWGDRLGRWSWDPNTEPHYVNYIDRQGARTRRLCFPYEYLRQTIKGALELACDWLDTSREFIEQCRPSRPVPSCWWADGR